MFVLAEAQPRLTRLVHGCQCPGNILKRIKAGIFVVMFKALGKFAKMCFVSWLEVMWDVWSGGEVCRGGLAERISRRTCEGVLVGRPRGAESLQGGSE